MFLDKVTIFNYKDIQLYPMVIWQTWCIRHRCWWTSCRSCCTHPRRCAACTTQGRIRWRSQKPISGDKSNHQDILPFDPKYYPFGDQCHEWVNPIKGRQTSFVQRLPDVPAPFEPWMSCGSGCKIQIIPSTWANILFLLFLIRSLLLIAVFAGNTSCLSFLRPLWSSSTR